MRAALLLLASLTLGTGPRRETAPATPTPVVEDEAALKERVRAFLGSIDTPIPASRWRALGVRAGALLQTVIDDPAALPTTRARAVEALAAIGAPGLPERLQRLALSPGEPLAVRLAAVRGVAAVASPDRAGPMLLVIVGRADDVRVRAGAALVSARWVPGACTAVETHAAGEPEEAREHFHAAIRACRIVEGIEPAER